ncbi:MAG: hypothetical protein IJL07_10195 [Lachnospiraceae bacterium]|nr:hypothetical protein [Lachnospiraceae bacterium]
MNKEIYKAGFQKIILVEMGILTLPQLFRVIVSRKDDFIENLIWFGVLAVIWGVFFLGVFTVRYTFEEDHLAIRKMTFKRKVPYEYIARAELVQKDKKGRPLLDPLVYLYDRDNDVLARVLPVDKEGFLRAIETVINKKSDVQQHCTE